MLQYAPAPISRDTLIERFDFSGKTIFPFVTYAVSGLGPVVRDYTASCPGATTASQTGSSITGCPETLEGDIEVPDPARIGDATTDEVRLDSGQSDGAARFGGDLWPSVRPGAMPGYDLASEQHSSGVTE